MDTITYHPAPEFRTKLFLNVSLLGALIIACTAPITVLIGGTNGGASGAAVGLLAALALNALWLLPGLVLVAPYYRSLRYEIREDEVIVYAGVLTKSVKHVPYRTVTNLEVNRGPFDRLFGIGALEIQTAGMSGRDGAEEKLAGLVEFESTYELVAERLGRYRDALPPTQSSSHSLAGDQALLEAILEETRAIRDLMVANQKVGDSS